MRENQREIHAASPRCGKKLLRMRTKHLLFALVGATLLLAGCGSDGPSYNTSHPEQGKIILTTDWTERTAGVAVPENYTVRVGDYSETLSGERNTLNHLFAPGAYRSYIYSTAEHISVSGTVAFVAETSVGHGEERFVHNTPEWFFACATDMTVEADTDHEFTAVMDQQIRQLTLVLELSGDAASRVTGIEGYLSGVAGTLDLDSGEHGTVSNTELTFVKDSDGKYKATVRLLGVVGNEQKLTAQIHYEGENPTSTTLESELTAALTDFNKTKKMPLTLDGEIVETPTSAGFTATINDWKPVYGEVTAN